MTEDGAWIRMEEYELLGDETEIKSMFAVFARTEELLNTTPLDQYSALLNLLETALGTSAIMQPEASVAPATHNTLLAAASTSTNDDPHPRASPHPHVEQSQPHGPLPDLSKDQLRSYIHSHCLRGGDYSVGTVRFRSALLRGELQAGPHHTDDVRRRFQGRYSSPRWWQTHVVFQGHRNGDSMRVHRPWVSLLEVACTPTLPFTSVIQCHIAI